MGMDIRYFLVQHELELMSRYLDVVQVALDEHWDDLEERYKEDLARTVTDDDAAFLDDKYTDEFMETGRAFPQLLLLSFIVTWFSFVEKELIALCERLRLSISLTPTDNVHLGRGVWRARRFLIQCEGYEIDHGHWQELVSIGKVRNTIVHRGARLKWTDKPPTGSSVAYDLDYGLRVFIPLADDVYNYLEQRNMIEPSGPWFKIVPSLEYCKHLIEFGRELFRKLYADLAT